jgi:hypothetical protein
MFLVKHFQELLEVGGCDGGITMWSIKTLNPNLLEVAETHLK